MPPSQAAPSCGSIAHIRKLTTVPAVSVIARGDHPIGL
jgi:hypothetical protein